MNLEKIGKFEAICLILIIIVNEIVLNVPNLIIYTTGSSAILNVIFISIIAIIFSLLLAKLFNSFSGMDIIDISEFLGGRFLKTITSFFFLIFFIFLSSIGTRYLTNSIKIIYFNSSPFLFILLFFIVPSVIINKYGLKAVSSVNVVFIIIVIVSLLFLLACSYKNFSITRMFPIFGKGLNETFLSGATNIFAFTGLAYLFLMPSLLKKEKDFKKVTITSIILTSLFLIFSISSLILTLPIITKSDEMLSIYLLTRMVDFGNFLERLDALFIFAWLLSLLASLSVNIFFIMKILKKSLNLQDEKSLASPIGLIILSGALLIKNYAQIKFLGDYIYKYGFIALVFGFSLPILLLANIKYKKINKL